MLLKLNRLNISAESWMVYRSVGLKSFSTRRLTVRHPTLRNESRGNSTPTALNARSPLVLWLLASPLTLEPASGSIGWPVEAMTDPDRCSPYGRLYTAYPENWLRISYDEYPYSALKLAELS